MARIGEPAGRERGGGAARRLLAILVIAATASCEEPTPPEQPATTAPRLAAETSAEPPRPRPSVLLVTLDTTRADRLGAYGYDSASTPALDRLATEGALFTDAIAQASVTPVSHASIFTGLNPYSHGLRVLHGLRANRLAASQTTLAERLTGAGYRTAAFVSAFPAGSRFGLDQGFAVFDEDYGAPGAAPPVGADGTVNTGLSQRGAAETTARALAWLDDGGDDPFFLWVHYFDPHDAILKPPRDFLARFPPPPEGAEATLATLYDIEIAYVDRHLGRLLDALRRRSLLDEMVTVITADHGEGLGDHDWWTHGILYQEQIRIPLLIKAPGVAPGVRVDHLVRSIDIAPTVLELVGATLGDGPPMQGVSLVGLLDVTAGDPGLAAYSDSVNLLDYTVVPGVADHKDEILFSVTRSRWKYIHHHLRPEESELFDRSSDPGETLNLYAQRPDVRRELQLELRAHRYAPRQLDEPMAEEDRQRLRSLGYVD